MKKLNEINLRLIIPSVMIILFSLLSSFSLKMEFKTQNIKIVNQDISTNVVFSKGLREKAVLILPEFNKTYYNTKLMTKNWSDQGFSVMTLNHNGTANSHLESSLYINSSQSYKNEILYSYNKLIEMTSLAPENIIILAYGSAARIAYELQYEEKIKANGFIMINPSINILKNENDSIFTSTSNSGVDFINHLDDSLKDTNILLFSSYFNDTLSNSNAKYLFKKLKSNNNSKIEMYNTTFDFNSTTKKSIKWTTDIFKIKYYNNVTFFSYIFFSILSILAFLFLVSSIEFFENIFHVRYEKIKIRNNFNFYDNNAFIFSRVFSYVLIPPIFLFLFIIILKLHISFNYFGLLYLLFFLSYSIFVFIFYKFNLFIGLNSYLDFSKYNSSKESNKYGIKLFLIIFVFTLFVLNALNINPFFTPSRIPHFLIYLVLFTIGFFIRFADSYVINSFNVKKSNSVKLFLIQFSPLIIIFLVLLFTNNMSLAFDMILPLLFLYFTCSIGDYLIFLNCSNFIISILQATYFSYILFTLGVMVR